MSEPAPPQATPADATRRRWIPFGAVVAGIAVLISALTLYNSYRERSDAEADRHVAERRADAKAATLVLKGAPVENGAWLTVSPLDGSQTILDQKIIFPNKLLVDSIETTGDGRIQADWFDTKLKRLRHDLGRGETSVGDERLPVGIASRFFVDGAAHDDVAIYDIGYAIEDAGFLKGKPLRLRGLSLVERSSATRVQTRLDALWAARATHGDR